MTTAVYLPYNLPAAGAASLALAELLDRLGWQDAACELGDAVVGEYAQSKQDEADIRADAGAMKRWGEKALFTAIAEGLAKQRIEDARQSAKLAEANARVAGWIAGGWTGDAA